MGCEGYVEQNALSFSSQNILRKVSPTPSQASNKLFSTASKIAFHLNKAAIRMKRNWKNDCSSEDDVTLNEFPRIESARFSHDLCVQLSSIEYPNIPLTSFSNKYVTSKGDNHNAPFLNLNAGTIVQIATFLDAESVLRFGQVCSKIRNALSESSDKLRKRAVTSHEIVIAFNSESQKVDVRALRKNRSIRDEVFRGHELQDVVPKLLHCMAKVTFGNGVNVYDWKDLLIEFHTKRRLTPLTLMFSGGALSRGNNCSGADLRSFTENEFVSFVGRFYPHVQEVQLLTTRLFKASSTNARLLSFISMIGYFGISYERPAVRYFFEEVKQVVSFWRHDPLARSCVVYMRAPAGSTMLKWMDLGGTVAGCSNSSHRVTIPHVFQSEISLIFHLH